MKLTEEQRERVMDMKRMYKTVHYAKMIFETLGGTPEDIQLLELWDLVPDPEARGARARSSKVDPSYKEKIAAAAEKHLRDRERSVKAIQEIISPTLDNTVLVYMDSAGEKSYLEKLTENQVKAISSAQLDSLVAKTLLTNGHHLLSKQISEHVKTWSLVAETVNVLPASISIQGELTYNQIKLDLKDSPTPTWDYFLSKAEMNERSLMAFVWAMFEKDCKLQQYLFLEGPGRDGKGSFIRWLENILCGALAPLSASDKYWPANCIGRRVGVFNDLNNVNIVLSSTFKQIVGGDSVSIEQKYEKSFGAKLDTFFILTSNKPLMMTSEDSDKRRCIYVKFKKDTRNIENYEHKLKIEANGFLFKCKKAFEELYDDSQNIIKCDRECLEEAAASNEERYLAILETNFILGEEFKISPTDFTNTLNAAGIVTQTEVSGFKQYLKRVYSIERSQQRIDGHPKRFYFGIKRK